MTTMAIMQLGFYILFSTALVSIQLAQLYFTLKKSSKKKD